MLERKAKFWGIDGRKKDKIKEYWMTEERNEGNNE